MKRIIFILITVLGMACLCAAQTLDSTGAASFRQEGIASWYGAEFAGRPTASGEIFNPNDMTAAHPNLPFGTVLRITNTHNGKQVTVRVNDRGPFVAARIIDLSRAAAEALDMVVTGTAPVVVESLIQGPVQTASAAPEIIDLPAPPVSSVPPAGPSPAPAVPAADPDIAVREVPPAAAPVLPERPVSVTASPQPAVSAPVTQAAPPKQPAPLPPEHPPAAPQVKPVQTAQTAPSARTVRPAEVKPQLPDPGSTKQYRIQVGSYKIARNAVDAFDKLKNSGLQPAYERHGEYYRVVLAGIRASDIQSLAETLGKAGFREVLIREER